MTLEATLAELKERHGFSDGSIALLQDKGAGLRPEQFEDDLDRLSQALSAEDKSFLARRRGRSWMDRMLDEGDSPEMTSGRYAKYTDGFEEISSEQALVQGRFKLAIEYMISLGDLVGGKQAEFMPRPFNEGEKERLRSIYQSFYTKDYVAFKLLEGWTNHDVVAANTWLTIRAQQLGLDDQLVRKVAHFALTSADIDTNVMGELCMKAVGKMTRSLGKLVGLLEKKAKDYAKITCIAETHGQPAQLTTLGHMYGNLAEQIRLHATPLLGKKKLVLDGKMAGAIGTNVDFKAAFPKVDPRPMYKDLVERVCGLEYVELGNDQDCSNAAFAQVLDTLANIGSVVQKTAMDTWLYASHKVIGKKRKRGESGSSAMPQKANPWKAEGAEALQEVFSSMVVPIKKMVIAYREQGDLRRSIAKREVYHPLMLWTISVERLVEEMENYVPNVVGIEQAIYQVGPQIASSALQNYLRGRGVADAYDRVKDVVGQHWVKPVHVERLIKTFQREGGLSEADAEYALSMIEAMADTLDAGRKLEAYEDRPEKKGEVVLEMAKMNRDTRRRASLLGTAVRDTYRMAERAQHTITQLERYAS